MPSLKRIAFNTLESSPLNRWVFSTLAMGFAASVALAQPAPADESDAAIPPPEKPTVVEYDDYHDPLQPVNRVMFAFNDVTYRYIFIPASRGYLKVVPKSARKGIGNVFRNLRLPISAVNHALQLKFKRAGQNLARFGVNTTIGIGGVFDPATKRFDIPDLNTDFEGTLARYNVGYGVYLVLPFFGSSDLRNGVGRIGDYFAHPVPYLVDSPASTAISAFDFFQDYAPSAESYLELHRKSATPYIFFRNLYLQGAQRDAEYEQTE